MKKIIFFCLSFAIVANMCFAKKHNPYNVKCIFGYQYWVWEKAFRGIPILNKEGNMIKCLDNKF